jgi:hypothetical protein
VHLHLPRAGLRRPRPRLLARVEKGVGGGEIGEGRPRIDGSEGGSMVDERRREDWRDRAR